MVVVQLFTDRPLSNREFNRTPCFLRLCGQELRMVPVSGTDGSLWNAIFILLYPEGTLQVGFNELVGPPKWTVVTTAAKSNHSFTSTSFPYLTVNSSIILSMASPSPQNPRILALFDVDGTLTVPRGEVTPEMMAFMKELATKITVGIVGGKVVSAGWLLLFEYKDWLAKLLSLK